MCSFSDRWVCLGCVILNLTYPCLPDIYMLFNSAQQFESHRAYNLFTMEMKGGTS